MARQRFATKIDEETGSTTGVVLFDHNKLNQRRLFAFDGGRYFYQPDLRSSFLIVSETELSENLKKSLQEKWNKTRS